MKLNVLLNTTLFILFCACGVTAQIYVKHDAAGTADGSSWANAYTNLQLALDASSSGDEIWIAAGTYLPPVTGDTKLAYFQPPHDVKLYGGFAGTETQLNERDWNTNITELSGDHNGDDVMGDFGTNREDNSYHVMWLTDVITTNTIIDGITFRQGTTAPSTGAGEDRRGGGILTYGAPVIRNCIFTQNVGHFGGGLYPRGSGAASIVISNCQFLTNNATFGGGIYINSTTGTIDSCHFQSNVTSSTGGGIYNGSANGIVISNSTFVQNSSLDSRGGGIYCTGTPSTIVNCFFDRNRAVSSTGGAIHVRNSVDTDPHVTVQIANCTFERNQANWGGAVGVYDKQCKGVFTNCRFEANSSAAAGGASTNGFGGQSIFTDCLFEQNSSNLGGVHFNQNDSAYILIEGCDYSSNTALERGGVMHFTGDNDPNNTEPLSEIHILRSYIVGNTAIEQGGALNISNVNLTLERSVLGLNFCSNGDAVGGGISFNTSDSISTNYRIINSTITQNTASIGAGVANWLADSTGSSLLTIQNSILHNPDGNDYDIEDGEPILVSEGGNLSSDNSMTTYLTATNDVINTDPGFVDDFVDYHLNDDSPCVNTGIDIGASNLDIEGNAIVGITDKGAYENQIVVSVRDFERDEFGTLNIFPNPVHRIAQFDLENDWQGQVDVQLITIQGKVVLRTSLDKNAGTISGQLDLSGYESGIYFLQVSNREKYSIQKIMKK